MGARAIFGPSDQTLSAHVQSVCDALDIPHIESRVDLSTTNQKEFSINLHPSQMLVNAAFQDLMSFLNWTKVAIVYERNYGLVKLHELAHTPGLEIHVRHADQQSYLPVLSEIKNKEIHNLIIDIRSDHIAEFLKVVIYFNII